MWHLKGLYGCGTRKRDDDGEEEVQGFLFGKLSSIITCRDGDEQLERRRGARKIKLANEIHHVHVSHHI